MAMATCANIMQWRITPISGPRPLSASMRMIELLSQSPGEAPPATQVAVGYLLASSLPKSSDALTKMTLPGGGTACTWLAVQRHPMPAPTGCMQRVTHKSEGALSVTLSAMAMANCANILQ